MKTINWTITISMLALLAGVSCEADQPQLNLHGKTVMIFPIMIYEPGKPGTGDKAWEDAVEQAESLGVMLERGGMHPCLSPQYPESLMQEENLAEVAKQLQISQSTQKVETDYILLARFEGRKTTGKKYEAKARVLITDTEGRIVWSQDPEELSPVGLPWRLGLHFKLVRTLYSISDLEEPQENIAPGKFETQLRRKNEAHAKEGEKRFREKAMIRRLTGAAQEQMEQEELAKEIAAYKLAQWHVGEYADQGNPVYHVELNVDGSAHIHFGAHEIKGTFAVVKGDILVLTFPGHGCLTVGRIEGNKLISNGGDVLIKTEANESTKQK